MKKILGILGGYGPLATAFFLKKIVLMTDAKCDQEHLHVVVDSNPVIPDRMNYIFGHGPNPLPMMIESAQRLEKMGAHCIVMPCNTAHFFYDDIIRHIEIPFLNMIDETAIYIKKYHPNVKKAGLLASKGTYKSGLYVKACEKHGVQIVNPTEKLQDSLTEIIYQIKSNDFSLTRNIVVEILDYLKDAGVELIISGCTEFPVLFKILGMEEEFIDTTTVLAKCAIEFLGKKVRNDLPNILCL